MAVDMAFRLSTLAILALLISVQTANAAEGVLTLSFAGKEQHIAAKDLLSRSDATSLTIPYDVSYHHAMSYRAVRLLALIGNEVGTADTIEARANDGFVAQLPTDLVMKGASGGSVAWIAIEDPELPWPNLPGESTSAGPFYLVWEYPDRSNVGSEQWPFALATLTGVADPLQRWPQLAIDPSLPEEASERRGQAAFIKTCIPCHRLKGAGQGEMGPDLGQPMNVTDYMKREGIHAIIRDPKSVRMWPAQQMPAIDSATVSDADIDALIAYFTYLAKH
jgi:mono/diheme cytochrome c family protein